MTAPGCRLSPDIYETLRGEILSLRLPPGTALSENAVSKRFGVSRTPIRSVFERLRSDQLLEVYPRRGTFVTLLDLDMIEQILYLRSCVERDILHSLAGSSDRLLWDKLAVNLRMQKRLVEENASPEEFYQVDGRFHELLFKAAGKGGVWQILCALQVHYTRYRMLVLKLMGDYGELYGQHSELVALLRAGEGERAAQGMGEHLYGGMDLLKKRIATDLRGYFLPGDNS